MLQHEGGQGSGGAAGGRVFDDTELRGEHSGIGSFRGQREDEDACGIVLWPEDGAHTAKIERDSIDGVLVL